MSRILLAGHSGMDVAVTLGTVVLITGQAEENGSIGVEHRGVVAARAVLYKFGILTQLTRFPLLLAVRRLQSE